MLVRTLAAILSVVWLLAPGVDISRAQLLGQPASAEQIVTDATNVLAQTVAVPTGIPQRLISEASAIAIVPNMVRGAFVVGLQHGRGVLLVRGPDGAWQPPQMIQITGGSIGYQIGVQSTDLILVFNTPQSVANLMNGTIKIGVDASAAAGPVGRQASAATDLPMKAEILSYSRARGAFIGVSIDGSSISLDPAQDAVYYQPPGTIPASAMRLMQMVTAYATGNIATVVPPTPTTDVATIGAPHAPSDMEAARQQLDSVSRPLAAQLDADWKRYLALPAEVYMPGHVPSQQLIQQAIARYEEVSRRPEYAPLTSRPEFQETLKSLWRFGELQQGQSQAIDLPPPPKQ